MPRVIKHPDIRKAELIDAAQSLFFDKGYDATSVEEIIRRAGISKGAFYYYFSSKEAVLEALAERMAVEAVERVRDLLDDEALNAYERLHRFLQQNRRLKAQQAPEILASFEALFRPENLSLYHHVHGRISRVLTPVMAGIVRQGMEEGTFLEGDPEITAEILLSLSTTTHSVVGALINARTEPEFRLAADAFEKRFAAQGIVVDRILGLPDGSIEFIEPGFAEAFFRGWQQRQPKRA
jgi:AcrR family transcriptional regulator